MPQETGDREAEVDALARRIREEINLARRFEHVIHWWREPLAGIASLAIGCYDTWHFGRNDGLTSSLDEVLIISGIVLIAGSRRLFGGMQTRETDTETVNKPGG